MAKQKPILEWLEMLPDGYREICKAEYDEMPPDNRTTINSFLFNLCLKNTRVRDRYFFDEMYRVMFIDNLDFAKLPPLPENWQDLYKDKLPEGKLKIKKPKNPNKKRDKLAIKIFLAWAANPKAINGSQTFDTALEVADQIIKKLNQ